MHCRPGKTKAVVVYRGRNDYEVDIDAPAYDDKANQRLRKILADHFDVALESVEIRVGMRSRRKIVEILWNAR